MIHYLNALTLTVITLLQKHGGKVYIVGGWIRDFLKNVPSHDIDLACSLVPSEVLKLNGHMCGDIQIQVIDLGSEFGTVMVRAVDIITGQELCCEVTTLRADIQCDGRHAKVQFTDLIEIDLARRDFTMNAIAYDLQTEEIIDPYNGIEDLKDNIIRAVGNPIDRYKEDMLRMVRCCRFTGYYGGMKMENQTFWAMYGLLDPNEYIQIFDKVVSKERIRDEIIKMMKVDKPSRCIWAMKDCGLLKYVFEPLVFTDVEQNKHHNESVFDHSLDACDYLPQDKPLLRLAGLFHDISKPESKAGEGDNCTFHNHEILGAKVVYHWAKDMKFSNDDCEYLSRMVRGHMFHFEDNAKTKTIKKWMNKNKGIIDDLFLLRMADRASNRAKMALGKPLVTEYMTDLRKRIQDILDTKEPMSVKDLAINGENLISMGFIPGPKFGKILDYLLEKVLEDPELNQVETLKKLVKAKLWEELISNEPQIGVWCGVTPKMVKSEMFKKSWYM